ncbi:MULTISPECIES: TetR/AcrR family transcriptional regulator [unclassified Streptomyces]|uniref:TetR/AcrR family transcriptional regulator n=1 Tax=unclassified Streptomyces TaxID=2593676 RepID=UPI0003640A5C|nr:MULTISPECIES: TetR/AcrR family transcriptional regulator [unclassified Streptomyces]MYX33231.1 TetR family transcriptional regulator [Streptomyces sp. SID8377]
MAGRRQFDEQYTLGRILDVFWNQGYGATSMQDLATASGVQRGSLYNAYRDKETLFLRVFRDYADAFVAEAAATLDQPDVRQALEDFFDFTIASMTRGTPARGCLSTKTATDTQADAEPIRIAIRGMLDRLEGVMAERLSREDAAGLLTVPPTEAARVLVTMTRGTVVIERVYQDADRLRATARSLIAILLGARRQATV